MKVLIADTETTGLDPAKGDRIIEICFLTYDFASRELEREYVQRFDPRCPINPKAQEVHGISRDDLIGEPEFHERAGEVHQQMEEATVIVAHNLPFDASFIASELNMAGKTIPANLDAFDTLPNARWATPDGKSPKLAEMAFALNVPFDDSRAHSALYDTKILAECFFKAFDRGFFNVPALAART